MRATVSILKDILDKLVKETKTKRKASAVKNVINKFLREKKIERIKAMKGKLNFVLTTDEVRHYE